MYEKSCVIHRVLKSEQKKAEGRIMGVLRVTKNTFDTEVLNAEQKVLVDFYADWCGPCKMMAPVMEEIAEEMPEVKVCKINVDENIEIAQKYAVMSIPTFFVFDKGEITGKTMGAQPKEAMLRLLK